MSTYSVGIIGTGAIGRELARAISLGHAGLVTLSALFDLDSQNMDRVNREIPSPVPAYTDFEDFLTTPGLQLVVESASPEAVRAYATRVLGAGKDLIVMSAGALVDKGLFLELSRLCEEFGRRLLIPSGALGGIDAIRSARPLLESVTLTTMKPPGALKGSLGFKEWEMEDLRKPEVVFFGPASEAVTLFPANVNVAATLSLAGLGPERTMVRVVADPEATNNVHEIEASGSFGVIHVRLENYPHPENPRTSHLAVLAAVETVRAVYANEPRIGT